MFIVILLLFQDPSVTQVTKSNVEPVDQYNPFSAQPNVRHLEATFSTHFVGFETICWCLIISSSCQNILSFVFSHHLSVHHFNFLVFLACLCHHSLYLLSLVFLVFLLFYWLHLKILFAYCCLLGWTSGSHHISCCATAIYRAQSTGENLYQTHHLSDKKKMVL